VRRGTRPARRCAGPVLAAAVLLLGGCQYPGGLLAQAPSSAEVTSTYQELAALPEPGQELVVAIYDFPDLTGQYKPSETVTTYSRAVSQGAAMVLTKALRDAGRGRWFRVIERRGLDHLLKERQIIRETRAAYAGGQPVPPLPPLVFAGLLIEGGIVGFDSNTITGGAGARYLGIGGDVQYRQDTVTVYANAVSSQSGEVLKSVTARKTIASYALHGGVFRFISYKDLLEIEAGLTVNEPAQLALQQAVEHLVRALVIEGAADGLWRFRDPTAGAAAIAAYEAEKRRQEQIATTPQTEAASPAI
jgi:curli production assembly/transport component CsgG